MLARSGPSVTMPSAPWNHLGLFLLGLSPLALFFVPNWGAETCLLCLLIPVGMLVYFQLGSGDITYAAPKTDSRPKAEYALYLPCVFGLATIRRNWPLVSWQAILPAVTGAVLLTLAVAVAVVRSRQECRSSAYVGLFVFAVAYGLLLSCFLNGALDSSAAQTRLVRVIRHYVYHGRSTTYKVEVAPFPEYGWGRYVSVSARFYDRYPVGSSPQLVLHPGLLGAPWFQLR
jgi:hypothetical protein